MGIDVVDWKLIGTCNLRCGHCYGPPKNVPALPLEDLLKLTETFHRIDAKWVVLTGGEPLLVKGIDTLMDTLAGYGINVALSTNGTYFTEHQSAIERAVRSLNIPLDGSTPEIHARSRRDTESYASFFEIMKHYKAHPERKPELIRVGTVYSKENAADMLTIASALEPYAELIDTWKVYEVIDYEFQPEARASMLPAPGEFERDVAAVRANPIWDKKLQLAPAQSRDRAFFMVNPAGQLVIPTNVNGRTYERSLGSLLSEPAEETVNRWESQIARTKYDANHAHYAKQADTLARCD